MFVYGQQDLVGVHQRLRYWLVKNTTLHSQLRICGTVDTSTLVKFFGINIERDERSHGEELESVVSPQIFRARWQELTLHV